MIEVLKPGPMAVVEDDGRFGLAAVGVSRSGAFDRGAYADGAALVGNSGGLAAIEVTLGGLVVRSAGHHVVALTGAECPATVNGVPVAWGRPFALRPADVLALGLPVVGLRSYLSVTGGFDVPPVLGSRSTDLLSGLGPARLAAGDFLAVGVAVTEEAPARAARPQGPPDALSMLPGPRTDWLADASTLEGSWTVSPDSNRIGVRLTGRTLARAPEHAGEELPSEPLVRGAVQLPPSGHPVLFGPDHPTTGGYPVVAVLTEDASDLLAQCRPGDTIRLRWRRP